MNTAAMTKSRSDAVRDHAPRYVVAAAWATPVMVVGQFALLSVIPVTIVAVGAWRDPRARNLRLPAVALAATLAAPIAVWASRQTPADSLSKDINPFFEASIVLASAILLYTARHASRADVVASA